MMELRRMKEASWCSGYVNLRNNNTDDKHLCCTKNRTHITSAGGSYDSQADSLAGQQSTR